MKNELIEIYRFLFIILICLMHFFTNYYGTLDIKYFGGGYLPVEFFFILSGFLLLASLEKAKEKPLSVGRYLLKKLRIFYPIYIISFAIIFLFHCISQKQIVISPINFVLEILMLSEFYGPINAPSWFLNVLLFVLSFVYFIVIKYRNYFDVFAPYIVILIYINLLWDFSLLDVWHQRYGLITAGVYRGIAGVILGCICYRFYCWFRAMNIGKYQLWFLQVISLTIILKIVCGSARNHNDFIIPILFSILIISAFLLRSNNIRLTSNIITQYLGKLSLSIFLNHWVICQIFIINYKNYDLKLLVLLYIIVIILWSVFILYLVEKLYLVENILRKIMKKVLI